MDVTALLVFVGGFAVCAGAVFLISIFGAKEETFEEALAKQRKANEKEKNKGKDKKKDGDKKLKNNWRSKKKGEKEEKFDGGLDDGEEEAVVVVPSSKVEELVDPVVVEPTPEPSPEPTPEPRQIKKEKKKEKKRIEIQEVEASIDVPEEVEPVTEVVEEIAQVVETVPEPIVEVKEEAVEVAAAAPEPVKAATKPSPAKQKVKKDKTAEAGHAAATPKELLAVVKKTAFNDVEAQKLIDVLLTKQSGDPLNTSEEWIERGKPTESQRLKQELTETRQALTDERNNGRSFVEKMAALKLELNKERTANSGNARRIEEFQHVRAQAEQQVTSLNGQMRQLVQEKHQLQGQLVAEQSHVRNVEMSFQVQVDSLNQQLEHARVAAATASANDPHLLSELEQLRALRDKYENSLAELNINSSNLQNKLSQQEEELKAMNIQLAETNEKVSHLNQCNGNLETALAGKNEEAKKIAADLSSVKLENEKMQTAAAAPSEAQIELASLKVKMDEKEINIVRLTEENERLSEQLASSVERPAAEGEEATNGVNGHTETPSTNEASDTKEVTEDWRDKFEMLHMEHEKMLAKQKTLQADFEAEVTKINGEAELIKNKNNDLNSSLEANKKSTVSLLHRLFPTLEQEEDVSKIEEQATTVIAELNAEVERLSGKCEEARKGEEEASLALGEMKAEVERISAKSEDIQKDTEELEKLQAQIDHYKSVLAQTEAMLTSLQASVESAETEWRLKLDVAKTELNELKLENAALVAKTTSAETSIEKQTEEVDNS